MTERAGGGARGTADAKDTDAVDGGAGDPDRVPAGVDTRGVSGTEPTGRGDRSGSEVTAATGARLVVVCGLPGVGKTTVSERVAEQIGAARLRTDVVRKEIVDEPTYSEAETERVYAALIARARKRLRAGDDVVLDATFRRAEFRTAAAELADAVGARFQLLKVECDQAVVERRIRAREGDESDADIEVHRLFREEYEALERDYAVVDNSGSEAETDARVTELF